MSQTIEDIILDHDKRGVALLRPHMAVDFCSQAAQYIMDHPGNVAIVTGFYILSAGSPETDGPAGAIAIGRALQALGRRVTYITDSYTVPVLEGLLEDGTEVVDFPIADIETSRKASSEILERLDLSLIISIERCSRTNDDVYLNMRYVDITPHTARLDYLFEAGIPSVGIGDGGNEIGMGNLVEFIPQVETLPNDPAVTKVDRLIISSVSNWGGYGLAASLSKLSGKNVLLSVEEDMELIKKSVDWGAVDGITTEQVYKVDGFTLEENAEAVTALHKLLEEAGVS
ncbi:MAG: DUF4392 domain-containing protein [Chloroflexi bacterium]|nr:DUF4392 domain-containing protein [Chloroflexota bacterium]